MRYDISTDSGLMLLLVHATISKLLPRLLSGDNLCFSTEQFMRERARDNLTKIEAWNSPQLIAVARSQLRSYPGLTEVKPDVWTAKEFTQEQPHAR